MLDAASDQVRAHTRAEFVSRVEAARMGTVFAYNLSDYQRWARKEASARPTTPALDDHALEAAVRGIAAMFPQNVNRVSA